MILTFPTIDVLKLAITSGTIPAAVQTSPVDAWRHLKGELTVSPSAPLSARCTESLQKLGVLVTDALPATTDALQLAASCWLQLLSLERLPEGQVSVESTTVLFRSSTVDCFQKIVSEMLRLGNDRQSFRHVSDAGQRLSLLRVLDPPYYTLLSALDANRSEVIHTAEPDSVAADRSTGESPTGESPLLAFVEQSPRVWVQIGYRHPLAERIEPLAGQFVLLEPPNRWQFVDEAPFQDVYSTLDLRLPFETNALKPSATDHRIRVPLRLVPGGASAQAELWVLRQRALDQVEQLLHRSDNELIERLAFAVVESGVGDPVVILRTRPSRTAPPILILDGLAYASFLKLPNLFVPLNHRLHPPLRRDAVSKLLAANNRNLTWLEPRTETDAQSGLLFAPQSIPDAAFRPLSDWVDYVLDHDHEVLSTWSAAHQFEFEPFVCRDDVANTVTTNTERASSASTTAKSTKPAPVASDAKTEKRPEKVLSNSASSTKSSSDSESKPRRATESEMQLRLEALEKQFRESSDALGSTTQQELWQRMAVLHSYMKHRLDTTICWCNCLWNVPTDDAKPWHEWLMCELRAAGRERLDIKCIDEILGTTVGPIGDASLVGAYLIYSLAAKKGVNDLKRRIAELTSYFLKQERLLPIRAVWLIARGMHELSGGDTLGLARARDRALERLFHHGLQAEFDVATFMRGGNSGHSDRFKLIRSNLPDLFQSIENWSRNKAYANLICAFGLAKIGEARQSQALVDKALESLNRKDVIHKWVSEAYQFRIQQAAQNSTDREPLSSELLHYLDYMDRLERYKVDRIRQQSRILEPHERIDPYRSWRRRYSDGLFLVLAELQDQTDPEKIRQTLSRLLTEHVDGMRGFRVLATALELAPRLGEQFALPLMPRVEQQFRECTEDMEKALLLQRAIYVFAHFGESALVQSLVALLRVALPAIVDEYLALQSQFSPDNKERIDTVETLFLQSFRGLRKLGMREEISSLYEQVAERLQESDALRRPRRSASDEALAAEARAMRLLLCVAAGWYYFGQNEEAKKVVERVKSILFGGKLSNVDQRALALAYVNAVANAPSEDGLIRIHELFAVSASGKHELPKIEDNMTTSTHFLVSQVELIEAVVLALVGDSSALSPEVQRWLDEDEFLIRKRIHEDIRAAV